MSNDLLTSMLLVAAKLNELALDHVFLGGSVLRFLLDAPDLTPVRQTRDVDVAIGVVAFEAYSALEERLRQAGFDHDMREGAPKCRWIFGDTIVDIMPAGGDYLGLNTAWFQEAVDTAKTIQVGDATLSIVEPAAFLATKLEAFNDRGDGDYLASHDLEDVITVVDGRRHIVKDVQLAPRKLRDFIVTEFARLLAVARFRNAIAAHLPPDEASQQRTPIVLSRLKAIAAI